MVVRIACRSNHRCRRCCCTCAAEFAAAQGIAVLCRHRHEFGHHFLGHLANRDAKAPPFMPAWRSDARRTRTFGTGSKSQGEGVMKHTLRTFTSLLVPRTWGGRVFTSAEFVHSQGRDRLLLRYVADSLYWRSILGVRGTGDFHSLVWEESRNNTWRPVASATHRAVRRVASAWVSGVHSLDPAEGVAIVQIGRSLPISADDLPPDVQGAFCGQYSWVAWDMRANRLLSILKGCRTAHDRYDA
jgi:hypothetical protein